MKSYRFKLNDKGFTLIEMAVVVIIVGIVISTMAVVMPSLLRTAKIKEAKAILDKFDYALQGFAIANNRLPFADSNGDGREDTDAFDGDLPYITIGLSAGQDAWGNPIRYAVYGEATVNGTNRNLTETTYDADTFCEAISDAITDASDPDNPVFYSERVFTTEDDAGCLATVTNASNQAFVIASGGSKDLDDSNGFFDGCNGSGPGFNSEIKRPAQDYDDVVKAMSLGELNRMLCTGGGSGGTGTGTGTDEDDAGVENTDALCDDGKDNDGDGQEDCYDPGCCSAGVTACPDGCPPSDSISISTEPNPIADSYSGALSYSHQFNASGGSGYYNWYIDSTSPQTIDGLSLSLRNGNLSVSESDPKLINSCKGTYTLEIRAEDYHDNSLTDTYSFTMEIEAADISVTPEPGAYPDYTVDESVFETYFGINLLNQGGVVGDITWTVEWQTTDPGGFQIEPTSDGGRDETVSAKFWKSGVVTEGPGTYTFKITAQDSSCPDVRVTSNAYSIEITQDGLNAPYTANMVGEWRFDECDTWTGSGYEVVDALDSQGDQRYNAQATGGVEQTGSGKICRAAVFDGVDDQVISDVFTGTPMEFGGEVTLACWFKSPGGGKGFPRLIEFSDATGGYDKSTCLAYDTDGAIRAWVTHESSPQRGGQIDYSATRYNDDKWHHAVYTYGPDGGNLYMDGVLVSTATDNPTVDIQDAETFVIGGLYKDTTHSFKGIIDEVMIFDKAFTNEEVEDLYTLTRSCTGDCYSGPISEYRMEITPWDGTADEVVDSGTAENHGVAAARGASPLPVQTTPSEGKVCRAADFTRDSSTQGGYINFGDPVGGSLDPGSSPFSISTWINWDGSTGENIIYNKETLYEARVQSGYVQYAWRPHWYWDGGTSFPVTKDTWVHVTSVYDGYHQILYKDGVPVYSRAQTGSIGSNSSNLLIGARSSSGPRNFFGGQIDEFRIYNRALAENEINTVMNETRDCPESVVISTSALADGTVASAYSTAIMASGGTAPYGWSIVTNPVSGLALNSYSGSTVNLTGTIDECAGDYDIVVKVTDDNGTIDQRTLTLTVNNGTLDITPAPQVYSCADSDFSQAFTITGPRKGAMENWAINWQSTDPGGFKITRTGDNTVLFERSGNPTQGSGYAFKISAEDQSCSNNTFLSGQYTIDVGTDCKTP